METSATAPAQEPLGFADQDAPQCRPADEQLREGTGLPPSEQPAQPSPTEAATPFQELREVTPGMDDDAGFGTTPGGQPGGQASASGTPAQYRPANTDGKQEYLYLSHTFVHQKLRAFTPPCEVELQLEVDGVMQDAVYPGTLKDSSAKTFYCLDAPPRELLLNKEIYGLRLRADGRIVLQVQERKRPLACDEGRRRLNPRVIGITTSIRVDFLKQCFKDLQEPRHPVNIKVEINGVRQPELFTGSSISHNRQGSYYVLGLPFALVHGRAFVAWRQLESDTLELAVQDVNPALMASSGGKVESASTSGAIVAYTPGSGRKGSAQGIVVDSRISIPLAMLKRDLGHALPDLLPQGLGPSFEIPIAVKYRVDGELLPRVYNQAVIKKSEHRGCCYLNGTERIPVKSKLLNGLELQPGNKMVILNFNSTNEEDIQRRSSPMVPGLGPRSSSRALVEVGTPSGPVDPSTTANDLLEQIQKGLISADMAAQLARAFNAASQMAAAAEALTGKGLQPPQPSSRRRKGAATSSAYSGETTEDDEYDQMSQPPLPAFPMAALPALPAPYLYPPMGMDLTPRTNGSLSTPLAMTPEGGGTARKGGKPPRPMGDTISPRPLAAVGSHDLTTVPLLSPAVGKLGRAPRSGSSNGGGARSDDFHTPRSVAGAEEESEGAPQEDAPKTAAARKKRQLQEQGEAADALQEMASGTHPGRATKRQREAAAAAGAGLWPSPAPLPVPLWDGGTDLMGGMLPPPVPMFNGGMSVPTPSTGKRGKVVSRRGRGRQQQEDASEEGAAEGKEEDAVDAEEGEGEDEGEEEEDGGDAAADAAMAMGGMMMGGPGALGMMGMGLDPMGMGLGYLANPMYLQMQQAQAMAMQQAMVGSPRPVGKRRGGSNGAMAAAGMFNPAAFGMGPAMMPYGAHMMGAMMPPMMPPMGWGAEGYDTGVEGSEDGDDNELGPEGGEEDGGSDSDFTGGKKRKPARKAGARVTAKGRAPGGRKGKA